MTTDHPEILKFWSKKLKFCKAVTFNVYVQFGSKSRHFSLISALITPKILVASWRQDIYSYVGVFFFGTLFKACAEKNVARFGIFLNISVLGANK